MSKTLQIKISKKDWNNLAKTSSKSCPDCSASIINGVFVHEKGCPSEWKSYKKECKWCGGEFSPEEKNQICCSEDCLSSYYD
jgi:hypothetical protein